jgi:hypothetical protein
MYAALSRSVCALPLNLIRGFETTSNFRFIKPKAVTVAALCGYEQKLVLPRFLPCWRMSSTGAFA